MAVKPPALYLLCGPASAAKSAFIESIIDTMGDQSILDRYVSNAKGAGMKVELHLHSKNP